MTQLPTREAGSAISLPLSEPRDGGGARLRWTVLGQRIPRDAGRTGGHRHGTDQRAGQPRRFVGPYVGGYLQDISHGGFPSTPIVLAAALLLGGLVMLTLRRRESSPSHGAHNVRRGQAGLTSSQISESIGGPMNSDALVSGPDVGAQLRFQAAHSYARTEALQQRRRVIRRDSRSRNGRGGRNAVIAATATPVACSVERLWDQSVGGTGPGDSGVRSS